MTSINDFTNSRRELKYNLYGVLDWAKDLEEKYQAVSQLVEILTHTNYKKDRKIQKLTHKLKKCKSDAKYRDRHFPQEEELENEELEEEPQKEVIDLTQIPEEEEPPIIPQPPKIKIEKIAKKVKIEEPVIIVIEEEEVVDDIVEEEIVIEEEVVEEVEEEVETEVEEEVVEEVETEVEEVVEEMVEEMVEMVEIITETEIEEQEEEENIEPELEPDVISEPEENQPTEEPILEKDDDDNMELIIEDPEEQEEVVEETAEEEEEELYEVVIGKISYYVANEENGPIYEITADQEVGEEVGQYVNRKPVFQPKSSTAPESQTEPETQEEEEIELIQIKINNINYAIENEIDGPIYSLGFDGDVDEEVGKYVKGKPTFYKK
jgi:hypothetical protein